MKQFASWLFAATIGAFSSVQAAVPKGADEQIRSDKGFPPKIDDFYFELTAEKSPWTYRLGLFEGAEQYLGTEIFMALPKKFAEIPGVKKVLQDDREWYLIQSEGLTKDQIRKALWSKFVEAASKSFKKGRSK